MIILGLDLSLTQTGYVRLNEDGVIVQSDIIKSKPIGTSMLLETKRLISIKDKIDMEGVGLIAIEGMAFAVRGTVSLVQLSGLNYMVREKACRLDIPFIIVAPATLKKFITGKGNCPKDLMMMETYKRFGVTLSNNNICDAFGLAHCALAASEKSPLKLTKAQEEVAALLKKQL